MPTLLQIWCGPMPSETGADAVASARGWDYSLHLLPEQPSREAATIASDNARFEFLAEHPATIYCDVDCAITDAFVYEPEDGQVHAGYYPGVSTRECKAQPDSFLIYGPCAFFQQILAERDRRKMQSTYCWPRKLLRDHPNVVQILPTMYVHAMETATKRRGKR